MKRQDVTHTIRQKVIPALLDSWVTNTPSVKMLCPQKLLLVIFPQKHNAHKCWSVDDRPRFVYLL